MPWPICNGKYCQTIVPSPCCRECPAKGTKGQLGADVAELDLPALPSWRFSKVAELSTVPPGDRYLQPTGSTFPAIDSIAVVGSTAYLIQITQNVDHGIKAGLLEVLRYLPAHLKVEFIWALPPRVWAEETFNAKDPPAQQGGQPATSGTERDSYDLIAKRLKACQQQYKIPVSVDGLADYSSSTSDAESSSSQGSASPGLSDEEASSPQGAALPVSSPPGQFSSSQSAALPETGSKGSVAAFSGIAEVTGRLQGADTMFTKVNCHPSHPRRLPALTP